ncbi:hypothetical protein Pcinc_033485, partial [Petrolisthes cinctipes]
SNANVRNGQQDLERQLQEGKPCPLLGVCGGSEGCGVVSSGEGGSEGCGVVSSGVGVDGRGELRPIFASPSFPTPPHSLNLSSVLLLHPLSPRRRSPLLPNHPSSPLPSPFPSLSFPPPSSSSS